MFFGLSRSSADILNPLEWLQRIMFGCTMFHCRYDAVKMIRLGKKGC